MMRHRALLAALALCAGCTCGPQSSGAPLDRGERAATPEPEAHDEGVGAPAAPTFEEAAGGLAWHAEEPLVSRRPSSSMRAAEYVVRDHPDAELTVFYFGRDQGGGVDENIDRWVGQFEQPDGRPSREAARIERIEVQDMPVTTVEVAGAFAGMRGMGGGGGAARPGFRMLGAIAEGPEGMVFFKLTGPVEAVDAAEQAFRALVGSIHPAG
jgi:hypothetical protein